MRWPRRTPSLAFSGARLYHIDDIPFEGPDDIPDVYTNFRKGVEKKSRVRPTTDAPDTLPPLPDDLDAGAVPSLGDLGFDGDGAVDERAVLPFKGGETRGLDRIDEYIWREDCLKKYKATRNGLLGANYSASARGSPTAASRPARFTKRWSATSGDGSTTSRPTG